MQAEKQHRKVTILLVLAALALPLLAFYGCGKAEDPWKKVDGGKLKVLVSFPPLYCFTKSVAGEDARVLSLLASTGPHTHRATVDDAQVAASANLFLVNGLELDDFVTMIVNVSRNKKITVVKVGEAIPEKLLLKMGGHEHEHADHHHGEMDPHVWLGIEQAKAMVTKIAAALKEADVEHPEHAANYDKRADEYKAKLDKDVLDYGKDLLKDKKNRKIVATHESLHYFCKSFDLVLTGSIMSQPGTDASGPEIARLVELCKKEKVRIIAIEPQYKSNAAETLKKSLAQKGYDDIVIVEIDPIETVTRDRLTPEYYIQTMQKNLKTLAEKMQ
jgi:zinc transport system substrate-binding protein